MNETTKSCLRFDERPTTPPEIRKYRRSTNLEPGKRFQHHGLADDYSQLQLDDKIYGITERQQSKITAADLINLPKQSDLEKINKMKSELIYKSVKREPLGKLPDRNTIFPTKFTEENVPFGMKSVADQPAKGLIFPIGQSDPTVGVDLYKKSHGSYGPGEQKSRGYEWPVDPTTTRFGRKGDTIAFNGVSSNITDVLKGGSDKLANERIINSKRVEDYRNMGDMLGQSKNLGQGSAYRPSDMVYGKPSASSRNKNSVGAAELIKGNYGYEDNQPDRDLGKSITPGFRNIVTE
eukprot:gene16202-22038_t